MQLASFLNNLEFSDSKVVITPLMESDFGKEIRIAFKEGQQMKEHKTKYPISVMTVIGSVEFTANNEVVNLNEGDVVSLEANVLHELKATEKSVVRLSLHKGDSIARVNGILQL